MAMLGTSSCHGLLLVAFACLCMLLCSSAVQASYFDRRLNRFSCNEGNYMITSRLTAANGVRRFLSVFRGPASWGPPAGDFPEYHRAEQFGVNNVEWDVRYNDNTAGQWIYNDGGGSSSIGTFSCGTPANCVLDNYALNPRDGRLYLMGRGASIVEKAVYRLTPQNLNPTMLSLDSSERWPGSDPLAFGGDVLASSDVDDRVMAFDKYGFLWIVTLTGSRQLWIHQVDTNVAEPRVIHGSRILFDGAGTFPANRRINMMAFNPNTDEHHLEIFHYVEVDRTDGSNSEVLVVRTSALRRFSRIQPANVVFRTAITAAVNLETGRHYQLNPAKESFTTIVTEVSLNTVSANAPTYSPSNGVATTLRGLNGFGVIPYLTNCGQNNMQLLVVPPLPGKGCTAPGGSIPVTFTVQALLGYEMTQESNTLRGPWAGSTRVLITGTTLPQGWEYEDQRSVTASGLGNEWSFRLTNDRRSFQMSNVILFENTNGAYENLAHSFTVMVHSTPSSQGSTFVANSTALIGGSMTITAARFNQRSGTEVDCSSNDRDCPLGTSVNSNVQFAYDLATAGERIRVCSTEIGTDASCIFSTGLDNEFWNRPVGYNPAVLPTGLSDDRAGVLPQGRRCPFHIMFRSVSTVSSTTIGFPAAVTPTMGNCLAEGDVIMLYCRQDGTLTVAGRWEWGIVDSVSASAITLKYEIAEFALFSGCDALEIHRVPQLTRLVVNNRELAARRAITETSTVAVTGSCGMNLFGARQVVMRGTAARISATRTGPNDPANGIVTFSGTLSTSAGGNGGNGGSNSNGVGSTLGGAGGGINGGNANQRTGNGGDGGNTNGDGQNGDNVVENIVSSSPAYLIGGGGGGGGPDRNAGGGGGGGGAPVAGSQIPYPYRRPSNLYFSPSMPQGGGGGGGGSDCGAGSNGDGGDADGDGGSAGANGGGCCGTAPAAGGDGEANNAKAPGGIIFPSVCHFTVSSDVGAGPLFDVSGHNGQNGGNGGAGGINCNAGENGGGGGGGGGSRGNPGGLLATRIAQFTTQATNAVTFLNANGGSGGTGGPAGAGVPGQGGSGGNGGTGLVGDHLDLYGLCTTCPYMVTKPDFFTAPDLTSPMRIPIPGPLLNDYACDGLGNPVVVVVTDGLVTTQPDQGDVQFAPSGNFSYDPHAPNLAAAVLPYNPSFSVTPPSRPPLTADDLRNNWISIHRQPLKGFCPTVLPYQFDRVESPVQHVSGVWGDQWGASADVSGNLGVSGGLQAGRVNVYELGITEDLSGKIEAGWYNISQILPPAGVTQFGQRVAIAGEIIAVYGRSAGDRRLHIYQRSQTNEQVWTFTQTIHDPDSTFGQFGAQIAMDGIWLMVSDIVSQVHFYKLGPDNQYTLASTINGVQFFGNRIDIAGDLAVATDSARPLSSPVATADVVVMRRTGNTWTPAARLSHAFQNNNQPAFSSAYASAIAVDYNGDIMVSDPGYNDNTAEASDPTRFRHNLIVQGAIFIFKRQNTNRWSYDRIIQPNPTNVGSAPAQPQSFNPLFPVDYDYQNTPIANFGRYAHMRDGLIVAVDARFDGGDMWLYDSISLNLLGWHRERNADGFGKSVRTSKGRFVLGAPNARGRCEIPNNLEYTAGYGYGAAFFGHTCRSPVPIDIGETALPAAIDPVQFPITTTQSPCAAPAADGLQLVNWETSFFGSEGSQGVQGRFFDVQNQRALVPGRLIDITFTFAATTGAVNNVRVSLSSANGVTAEYVVGSTTSPINIAAGTQGTTNAIRLSIPATTCVGTSALSLQFTVARDGSSVPCAFNFDVVVDGPKLEVELWESLPAGTCNAQTTQLFVTPLVPGVVFPDTIDVQTSELNVAVGGNVFNLQATTPSGVEDKIQDYGFGPTRVYQAQLTYSGCAPVVGLPRGTFEATIAYTAFSGCPAPVTFAAESFFFYVNKPECACGNPLLNYYTEGNL